MISKKSDTINTIIHEESMDNDYSWRAAILRRNELESISKLSRILLQKIDCNCNDCKHMVRNMDKFNSFNHLHVGKKNSLRVNYGRCLKFSKDVSFLPNTCQIDTQDCFDHRRG